MEFEKLNEAECIVFLQCNAGNSLSSFTHYILGRNPVKLKILQADNYRRAIHQEPVTYSIELFDLRQKCVLFSILWPDVSV